MKRSLTILITLLLSSLTVLHAAEPIRVLVWDEQQPQQKQAYGERFLGETIAAHLEKQPGLAASASPSSELPKGYDFLGETVAKVIEAKLPTH